MTIFLIWSRLISSFSTRHICDSLAMLIFFSFKTDALKIFLFPINTTSPLTSIVSDKDVEIVLRTYSIYELTFTNKRRYLKFIISTLYPIFLFCNIEKVFRTYLRQNFYHLTRYVSLVTFPSVILLRYFEPINHTDCVLGTISLSN